MEVVEAPFVRVPFEALKRAAKERKYIIEEVEGVMGKLKKHASSAEARRAKEGEATTKDGGEAMDVDGSPAAAATASAEGSRGSGREWESELDDLLGTLGGLKRKLGASTQSEGVQIGRCKARVEHLLSLGAYGSERALGWNKKRVKRLVVDYLLRQGYHRTALQAVEGDAALGPLVETEVFRGCQEIVDSLRSRSVGPALKFCRANASRLKRIKSKLEFKLRLREFLTLVQAGSMGEAVRYAQKHLGRWASVHQKELQAAMASLVYRPYLDSGGEGEGGRKGAAQERYGHLFAAAQWEELEKIFKRDFFALNCLAADAELALDLEAGLSALKTPMSSSAQRSKEDPLSVEALGKLAATLPFAKHSKSKLVCWHTREVMAEPRVLPNGMVYSAAACELLAKEGKIQCPRTGDVFELGELKKLFPV